jgi:flagellar hook-length control protein FliK
MTDAAPLLPLPPADLGARVAGGGLRPLDGPARVPGTGPLPAGDAGTSDPFAAVLQGFLGAALAPPATPPAPPPSTLASAAGEPATPAPAPAPALPDAALPAGLATAGGKPLPAAAGSGLPGGLTAPAAPPPADAAGLPPEATAAAAAAPDTATGIGYGRPVPGPGDRADSRGDAGAPATPATSEAAALLADLDRSRTALAPATRPVATATPGRVRAGELPDTTSASATATVPADGGLAAALADLTTTSGGTLAPASTGTAATGSATATSGTGTPARGDGLATGPGSGAGLAPLGDPSSFASGLGERLLDLGRDGTQSARLRLHPESLGPLDVRIQVEDGEARVWFNTAHGQTRDAIEASLPRLRELFAGQGIELGRVQVDVRSDGGGPPAWQPAAGDPGTGGGSRTPQDGRDAPVARRTDPWGSSGERAEATDRAASRLLDVLA